jgi:hypothetical protein
VDTHLAKFGPESSLGGSPDVGRQWRSGPWLSTAAATEESAHSSVACSALK